MRNLVILFGALFILFMIVSPVSADDTPWFSPNEGRTTEDSVIGTSHPLRIIDTADLVEYLSDEYAFIQKWGSYGTGDGQFSVPCGITIASDGLVYVTDFGNSRVQVFDSNGNYIRKWGTEGTGNGQFLSGPWGSAIHPVSGNIYVTDQNNHRVQVFDSTGTFIRKWGVEGTGNGQFSFPRGIAIDTDGNVYVVDSFNDRIQKFTADGTFIRKWGAVGTGDGQFNNPLGIAVHPNTGYIYVAEGHPDGDYSRIQVFDSNGNFIRKWGTEGTGNGQFHQPFGVAIDEVGNVFITDVYNYRVQVFDSNGNFITKWGAYGSGDGQFTHPLGIAVDAAGNVYVADGNNHRIQKFGSITPTTVLSGRVTDGVTGEPISGVTISIAGLSDITDDNGDYRIDNISPAYLDADFYADIRSGEAPLQVQFTDVSSDNAHTLTATKTGYTDYINHRVIVAPDDTTIFSFSMNPVLSPDSMRFILNWGANPRDLDLHLQTPEIEGTSYHVYYLRRGSLDSAPYAALDQDVVTGYGPETITTSRLFEGTYYLYVYLYAGTGTLATSEASIQLYNDEGLIQTLNVPATGTGRYWNIATINGATGHLSIVNQIQGDRPGVLSLELLSNELTTKPLAHDTLMATEFTYEWNLGDGTTSNERHPNHIYTDIGNYTVTLTVTNDEGDEDTETKVGYITVTGTPAEDFINILSLDPRFYPTIRGYVHVDSPSGRGGSLGIADFSVTENDVAQTITSVEFISGGEMEGSPIDIAIVFDDTGSMGPFIAGMKEQVIAFTDAIEASGMDARYMLVTYKGYRDSEPITLRVDWTYDADELKTAVDALYASDGGETPEVNLDALAFAMSRGFRPDAQRVILDITDAPTHYRGDEYGYSEYTIPEIADMIQGHGVTFILVSRDLIGTYWDGEDRNKQYLAEAVDGLWVDIDERDFSEIIEYVTGILTHQYVITYVTSITDTAIRTVMITVNDPTLGLGADTGIYTVPLAPSADFTADYTTGDAPLTVQFADTSTGYPTSWHWIFGDGSTSTQQHPSKIYTTPGVYTVALTVTNAVGSDTETKMGYITVTGAPIPPADLPEHSLYLGHTAVSIGYLIGQPVDAQTLVNTLISEQGLSMADLWYRIGDGAVVNILTGEEATPAQLAAIQAQLRTYIDENGNAHEIVHQYAVGRIVVGAMNFNDLYIDDVVGVPGATHFSVSEVDIIRAIGSDNPVTFMKAGSTTIQIYSDADGDTLIATGTLVIPGTFGEHPFEVSLELV